GVKKALASAWRAAVVVNTCLAKPEMADAATAFYCAREADIELDCRRRSASFFSEAAAAYASAFWAARADGAGDTDSGNGAGEPSVRAAFDGLRQASALRVRPSGALPRVGGGSRRPRGGDARGAGSAGRRAAGALRRRRRPAGARPARAALRSGRVARRVVSGARRPGADRGRPDGSVVSRRPPCI